MIPFLTANFSIRPEREAHAILGVSAGGYGAMSMAIEHHEFFGAVATLAGAINLRYYNADERYFENFDPVTYRWKTRYDARGDDRQATPTGPCGFLPNGSWARSSAKVISSRALADTNPADKLFTTDIQPGQLAIYANYGGRDNFNFDAQAESFAWLAASKGIAVTLDRDSAGNHSLRYLRANIQRAFLWLGQHLLPPTPEPAPR